MGTFIIRPTGASGAAPVFDALDNPPSNDYAGWAINNYPSTTILDGIQSLDDSLALSFSVFADADPNSYDDTLRATFSGDCIYLDGSPTPISYAGLPAGFKALTAIVKCGSPIFQAGPEFGGSNNFYLQQGDAVNGPANTTEFEYDFGVPLPPTMLDLVSNGMGMRCNIVVENGADGAQIGSFFDNIYNFRVEGTYEIESFDFNFNLDQPDEKVHVGDHITATSDPDEDDPIDYDEVLTVEVVYTDPDGDEHTLLATIISRTTNSIVFALPNFTSLGDNPQVLVINITSTQFSGSVTLGKLVTLFFLNAPGIYVLVDGKLTDTLYDIENGGTVEVKKPDPFIKTGFVGN